ncbi:MAG: ABC transporter substrate-binding protein, partial [Chloroflexota bacterium]
LNFEAIAELNPDVIVGVTSGMTEEEYNFLSEIAPTLPQSGDYVDYGVPWQEVSRVLGQAVGEAELADDLVTGIEDRFAQIRADHPEWQGATMAVAFWFNEVPGVYASEDARPRLLSEMGFVTPAEYDELAGDSFFVSFSEEEMPTLLDVDLIVWIAADDAAIQAIKDEPLRAALPAAQEGREIFLNQLMGGAFSFSSPLSLDFLLDEMVPMIEAAMDGDPNTEVPEAGAMAAADTADLIPVANVEGFPEYASAVPLLPRYERNGDTIVVEHAYGETEIPADPQRIYVNDAGTMQILLSLGIIPAATVSWIESHPEALVEVAGDVEILLDFTGEGVNPEELLNLEPDLILGHAQFAPGQITEDQYAVFSEIAPTVVFTGNPFFYWKEATLEMAELFGIPEKGVEVLEDYNSQLAELKVEADEKVGDDTVTILLLFDTTFWLYSPGGLIDGEGSNYVPISVTTWAYRELGLNPSSEVAGLAGDNYWAEISLEAVPEIVADRLVVWPNAYGGEEIGEGLSDYVDSPIWNAVPAVANDNVSLMLANNAVEGYWTTPYLIREFLDTLE